MNTEPDTLKKPFVKKFSDEGQYFVYDVNTNQILEVEEAVYDIIDRFEEDNAGQLETAFKDTHPPSTIRRSHAEIKNARAGHGLFSFFRPQKNTMGIRNTGEVKAIHKHGIQQLVLELTRNCNLNCAYCSTSGKYFHGKTAPGQMDIKTCQKALDFFHPRSDRSINPTVTFYGGEPLLRFDIIKEAVAYIKAKPGGDRYKYNLTTNGTLLNREHIDFFSSHDFGLLVSLDGPQPVNDRYRLFKNGKGTFNRIMAALKLIKNHNREYFKNKVSISSVFSPPYDDVEEIIKFFSSDETLEDIGERIRSSAVNTDETSFLEDFGLTGKVNDLEHVEKVFTANLKNAILENDLKRLPIEKRKLFITVYNIAKRQIKSLESHIQPLGSCHIGVRRLFVDVNGRFNICERVPDSYGIGSLEDGFNYENIARYYKKFEDRMQDCNQCWAMLHCDRCWSSIGFVDDFTGQRKEKFCQNNKRMILKAFKLYTQLLREDPDCMQSLADAFDGNNY